MAETDGMTQLPDGSYIGSVGISLNNQDIEDGDYTGGSLDSINTNEIISMSEAISKAGATNLLVANDLKLKMEAESIKATLKGSEMIQKSNLLLSKVVTNMATSVNESFNNSLLMNSVILEELQNQTQATKDLIQAIKDKQIEFNASSISMGDVSLNTSPIVEAINQGVVNQKETNAKIVQGIENQKETNAKIVENLTKKNEQLDFQKNGDGTTKDSSGNLIKPREVEAKKNAEILIEQKDTNETTFDDIEEIVNEALGIGDSIAETLGVTDGFDLLSNPIDMVDRILVKDLIETYNNGKLS